MPKDNARNAGRKKKLTEQQVNELIYLYKTEKQIEGRIKYLDMFRFNKEKFELGEVSYVAGEDFWRKENRLGKEMIDQANMVFSHKLADSNGNEVTVPSVVDTINKCYNQRDELIEKLLPLERLALKKIEAEKKLKVQLIEAENKYKEARKDIEELKKQKDELQDLVLKMFRYGSLKETPIVDFLTMKSPQSEIIRNAIEGIFDSPAAFIDILNRKNESSVKQIDSKTVRLADKMKERFR